MEIVIENLTPGARVAVFRGVSPFTPDDAIHNQVYPRGGTACVKTTCLQVTLRVRHAGSSRSYDQVVTKSLRIHCPTPTRWAPKATECPECFGTGLRGGLTVRCSKGCPIP